MRSCAPATISTFYLSDQVSNLTHKSGPAQIPSSTPLPIPDLYGRSRFLHHPGHLHAQLRPCHHLNILSFRSGFSPDTLIWTNPNTILNTIINPSFVRAQQVSPSPRSSTCVAAPQPLSFRNFISLHNSDIDQAQTPGLEIRATITPDLVAQVSSLTRKSELTQIPSLTPLPIPALYGRSRFLHHPGHLHAQLRPLPPPFLNSAS
jgi:hypothetical protein